MIAIETNEKNKVTWIHYNSDSLPDTTDVTLVEEIPPPEIDRGDIAELYYTPERGFWYEYSLVVPDMETPDEIPDYETLVNRYIRERYSVSDELAILRQREDKPDEFTAYYDYAESCKAKAKLEIEKIK